MEDIINEFVIESYEGLDRLDQIFVVLEESPDNTEALTEAFRVLHTIKGTCGFLAFAKLEKVAHRGENLLSLLRDNVLEMDEAIANALLGTVDAIRSILAHLEETGGEGDDDVSALIATLETLAARADHGADATTGDPGIPMPSEPEAAGEADAAPEAGDDDTADGTDGDTAAEGEAGSGGHPAEDGAAEHGPESSDAPTPAAEEATPAPEPAAPAADASNRIGDILVEQGGADRTDVEIAAAEQSLGDDRQIGKILTDEGRAEPKAVEQAASTQRSAADATIRVDVAVLDRLMNLVGELVLSRNQIIQLASTEENQEFAVPAQRLNLITSELQEGVMRTRMQPIGNVWNKLPRVVRDLSHQFDKSIRLEMAGADTELDRTILEAIKDPLTHMVRNTVDHGIEDPDTRESLGKDREGVLRLSATHEGGRVNIEISDDGAGIDADRMRAKAIEKEIISPDQAARMSDNEAVQLIFAPGFSTAQTVSNVSGRGVGMDVVRTNIERIGGSVDIQTEKQVGTTFTIKIPLTLAIIPAITVSCDENRYAIPQLSLQELVRIDAADTQNKIEYVHGAPVYRLRERLLPIIDLRTLLGHEPQIDNLAVNIVVLHIDGRAFGLVVDEIEDTAEIVVKPLGRDVKDITIFSGATIMGDGRVALILDVLGLASRANVLNPNGESMDASGGSPVSSTRTDLDESTVLLLNLGDGSTPVAIPLAQVERLEEFRPDQIEQSDGQPVVQYRGEIMPLLDLPSALGAGYPVIPADRPVSVVVCMIDGVSVGLAVHDILDIVSQTQMNTNPGERITTAVVNGHVTDVVDTTSLVSQYLSFSIPQGAY